MPVWCPSAVKSSRLKVASTFKRSKAIGLDEACRRLAEAGIRVSLFIDPDPAQLDAGARLRCAPSSSSTPAAMPRLAASQRQRELARLARRQSSMVSIAGLVVNAGHGLNYHNVRPIASPA
jgi:pyridoxine 5-phosphate synthase